jgi:triacylglycerol lipase
MSAAPHRVYFIPGMFGFGRLAGYDYFNHVRVGLERRFKDAGQEVAFEDVPAPPTSSLRYRSRIVATTIERTAGHEGPIHLVGHSTGGLDLRLVLSPTVRLGLDPGLLEWRSRVQSAVSINTPHYGTPVAGFFATVSGTRMLYALSLITVISLSIGEPSLQIFSRMLAGVGGIDAIFGGDLRVFSRVTDSVLRFVDRDARSEIGDFLSKVRVDQGGIIQLMPEAVDLFNASTEPNPDVRFGCIASAAPPPRSMRLARRIRSPYAAFTAAIYSTLYQFASKIPDVYPYARPSERELALLRAGIDHEILDSTNDGIVPTLSMLHGTLLWAGEADHLDVLGHFGDESGDPRGPGESRHRDWITSGSRFSRQRFSALLDALAGFQLDQKP